jgi:hypothetical protein
VVVNRVPFDPFSDQEKAFLRTLLEDRAPTLGRRTLERIDRAHVALERIAKAVSVPVGVLQDVWLDGPRLAEEMASLIAVEEAAR